MQIDAKTLALEKSVLQQPLMNVGISVEAMKILHVRMNTNMAPKASLGIRGYPHIVFQLEKMALGATLSRESATTQLWGALGSTWKGTFQTSHALRPFF